MRSECVENSDWNAIACPVTGLEEKGPICLRFLVPGLVWGSCCLLTNGTCLDVSSGECTAQSGQYQSGQEPSPAHYTSFHVGQTCLFGDLLTQQRCVPFTNQPDVTGPPLRGWYWHLHDGAPKHFRVEIASMDEDAWIVVAIKYPAGTSVTGRTVYKYSTHNSANGELSSAASLAAVLSGNGRSYYISPNGMLYFKVVNLAVSMNQDRVHRFESLYIPFIDNSFYVEITANCATVNTTSSNTGISDFCESTFQVPVDSVGSPTL